MVRWARIHRATEARSFSRRADARRPGLVTRPLDVTPNETALPLPPLGSVPVRLDRPLEPP